MAQLNLTSTRDLLQQFEFGHLFIEQLGWSAPGVRRPLHVTVDSVTFVLRQIAELGGVVVFEVTTPSGDIPDYKTRAAIHKEFSKQFYENLLIFVDRARTQSLWYWVKRDANKHQPRDHHYFRGQPGDLMLGKLGAMFFDMSELDDTGSVSVVAVAERIKKALDVEQVTKRFYTAYRQEHLEFSELIQGITDEHDRAWYASILLNRLMFIYFLQRKHFLDNKDADYLQNKLAASQTRGKNQFYREFLTVLFFEGFAKPEDQRSQATNALLGKIKYLNGGLFLPHRIETQYDNIRIPDAAFENLLALFAKYSWNLNDTPGGDDDEINPDVLGYIFEKYINQKAFGAYYTRPEITEYLSEQTIHRLILDKVNRPALQGISPARQFDSLPDLLLRLDASLARELVFEIMPRLSLLDPACGSGAFLVAAMKTLINIYTAILGKVEYFDDAALKNWLIKLRAQHPDILYYLKKRIITDNLFGVDIMEEAVEIARLRLFLALVGSAQSADQLEPLPNIDFNILVGNSLIGLLRVDEKQYDRHAGQGHMWQKPYREIVAEKDRLVKTYRDAATYAEDLRALRDKIQAHRADATERLNDLLLDEFKELGIQYEEYIWDAKKKQEVSKKRSVRVNDIEKLHPFHWGYEFAEIMNERGGFDAVITNPPWEVFKPNGKEFFQEYSNLVSKKKMRIEEFEKEQNKLLRDPEIRDKWFEYQSQYPYTNLYFRNVPQYSHQAAVIDGKKMRGDLNLYKLFTEQSYNLLRNGGSCGIVIPSSIYNDLGARGLRELLFEHTQLIGLFCFENSKAIFEGVHRSFKFVVLTFEKGGQTQSFPAAFMRHDVEELEYFPQQGAVQISVPSVRRLSPDSLSVMEFKSELDVSIAEKLAEYPVLGDGQSEWKVEFHREFHMTDDSYLFQIAGKKGHLDLYEGKMIWHFTHLLAEPRYWVKENQGRQAILGKERDKGQLLGYQKYRLAYRAIASNTNERTLVSTVIPPTFTVNSLNVSETPNDLHMLYCASVMNSFALDWLLRMKVTTNLNMFYLYQLPVPRLTERDRALKPIVERAARLICTTPEFDELAREVGLNSHKDGVTDEQKRAQLRAELDGIIAHLYNLTEAEFAHILATFPLVEQSVKDAALDAYRKYAEFDFQSEEP